MKTEIQQKLAAFQTLELRPAALDLLATLGYHSEKTIDLGGSPDAFLEQFDAKGIFRRDKALFDDWKEIQLLFQLTSEELSGECNLFAETGVKQGLMQSYLFFALKLKGESYPRGRLAQIARQLNRIFPMPVMVLFEYDEKLSIAVINRRRSKRDETQDVLGKVTLIQEISLATPHRGHLDILASFAVDELKSGKRVINSFETLHAAWEEVFNVELLNKRFYRKIQEWFFWAVQEVRFPHGGMDDEDQRNRIALIRLLTRVIFCWFAREKGLLPEKLFDSAEARRLLAGFDPSAKEDSGYYLAFLQNLFFAVLSIPVAERRLRDRREYQGRQNHYMNHSRLRYRELFADAKAPEELFADIPFLNGGLFDCLDYRVDEEGKNTEIRVDGFSDSRIEAKRAFVPNVLFFGKEQTADLHEAFNDDKKTEVEVDGLFTILENFKFTVTENTPIEEEIALDPELLGRIFENLLAEYNPETEKTARKETGSFYTPRTIVDYMVNESLKAYLKKALTTKNTKNTNSKNSVPSVSSIEAGGENKPLLSEADADEGLLILFAYTEKEHAFTEAEKRVLLDAIYDLTILDPACGSGAFPMGMLQKLVYVLEKLDHGHDHWKQRILKDTPAPMKEETRKLLERSSADFQWKLGLIQRCIYGIDIQPIAVQIAKLRCFVSLLVDFKINPEEENSGVPALPNLDFKFVAADSLIKPPSGIERAGELGFTDPFFDEFAALAEEYFFVRDPAEKKKLRDKIEKRIEKKIAERESTVKQKREQLLLALGKQLDKKQTAAKKKLEAELAAADREVALWESYRNLFAFRNAPVGFFDPRYFFPEIGTGFDITIGNPPYVQIQKFPADKKADWESQGFQTYAATADIYCLFYERGAQLLKPGGHLCYITSNNWMRANYGAGLRKFLTDRVDPIVLLDFGMGLNFGAAAALTNILLLAKQENKKRACCCYAADSKAAMENPERYFNENAVPMPELGADSWVVCSPERYKIKQAVEAQGIPLEKWELNIYRGVLTGLNDAFYLTQEQRDELIAKEPHAAEIIVPLLRGRYVERYKTNWDQTWMIGTFPALGIKLAGYPQIKKHLQQFRVKLEPKPKDHSGKWDGRKAGSYQWFETQDSIGYHEEFRKPKIIYQDITKFIPFYYDEQDHFFFNNTCWMMNSETESLPYLTAVFNSSLFRCCFRDNFPELLGPSYRLFAVFFEKIPIRKPTEGEAALFEKLVAMVQFAKKVGQASSLSTAAQFLEELIDACVLELYFPDEAAAKKLQFIADAAACLEKTPAALSEKSIREFIGHCTACGLDEKLNRLSACDAAQAGLEPASLSAFDAQAGPDLFAIIKQEGKV